MRCQWCEVVGFASRDARDVRGRSQRSTCRVWRLHLANCHFRVSIATCSDVGAAAHDFLLQEGCELKGTPRKSLLRLLGKQGAVSKFSLMQLW